ncbi:hypothetical protein HPB48_000925 [Haemaphysalis longicornis]|uniref:Uncharacterized protein n=1 Tax=Haemaphysalis longicornis TaxID=44386 RepID=A0A9J6FXS5_HAELO|nr:hypothetical protein HPB48_000925 [Haemaphysalis longicornis]
MIEVATRAQRQSAPRKAQSTMQKAAMFYRSCRLVYSENVSHLDDVRALLVNFGVRWPVRSNGTRLLPTLLGVSAAGWGWASVLQFSLYNKTQVMVRPSAFFEKILVERFAMLTGGGEIQYHHQYFDSMVAAFSVNGNRALSFEEHWQLEQQILLNLSRAFTIVYPDRLNNTHHERVRRLLGPKPFSHTEWKEQLRISFSLPEGDQLSLQVEHEEFFESFFSIVVSLGESACSYFVGWVIAQALSLLASSELINGFFMSHVEPDKGQLLFCADVAHTYMGIAFYADFLSKEVGDTVIKDVESIESSVHATFREQFARSAWSTAVPNALLDSEVVPESLKLVRLVSSGLLDQIYGKYPDMGDNIFENIKRAAGSRRMVEYDVSARSLRRGHLPPFSFSSQNEFVLLPVAMGMPFYGLDTLPAVKYAMLGAEFAYALLCKVFNKDAAIDKSLRRLFRLKTPCFFGREILFTDVAPQELEVVNRATSLRIVAKASAQSSPLSSPSRLPRYEDVTETQLLLVFWCLVQCGSADGHRMCNYPVTALELFANAFRCRHGSSMVSGRDCVMID